MAVHRDIGRVEMRAEQKRVTIGRLGQYVARRHDAAGAEPVLDHDRLLERLAELVGDEARRNVGRAAGAKSDHQPDRPARIGVGRGCRCGAQAGRDGEKSKRAAERRDTLR